MRRLNSHAAAVRVTMAMITMGRVLESTSARGMSLRKTPRTMIKNQRRGLIRVNSCSQGGMFSMGVAKPDRMMAGGMKTKAPRMACCWVMDRLLMKRPMPTMEVRKTTRAP